MSISFLLPLSVHLLLPSPTNFSFFLSYPQFLTLLLPSYYLFLFLFPPPSFRSNFSDFAMKYGKDERFKAMEKMRDREQLFSEYLSELKKASKMKDEQLRSAAKSKAEKVSKDIKH